MPAKKQNQQESKTKTKKENKAKPKTTVKEPQTMDELLASVGEDNLRIYKRGDKVEGVVTLVSKKVILVDIGTKTEGVIPEKEIKLAADFVKGLQVGDRIEAYVARSEDDKGRLLLTIRKTIIEHKWKKMQEYFETGESFEVTGTEMVRGGLLVDAMGLQGFIPASQFSAKWAGRYHELIGKTVPVKVIEVNSEINRLVLSEKLVTEAPLEEKKRKVIETIDKDAVYEGIITGTVPFGAFVKVKVKEGKTEEDSVYLDGLIHISEIAWEKVDDVNDYVTVGQKVKVKVISVDKTSAKLQLSLKRLTPDPWKDIDQRYPVDTIVTGRVKKIEPFGAFVNIEPGVDALLHISRIPSDVRLKEGEKIKCYIESIDPAHRRLSVGLVTTKPTVLYK